MLLKYNELFLPHETFIITGDKLLAHVLCGFVYYKERQHVPYELNVLREQVVELYSKEFEKISNKPIFDEYECYLKSFASYDELYTWLRKHIRSLPEIQRNDHVIDLGDYIRNLCHDLIRSCIEIDFSSFLDWKQLHSIVVNIVREKET